MAWLAVLKYSPFVYSFAADILRRKVEALEPVLRLSDYETFLAGQTDSNPRLGKLAPSTRTKIHRVLLTMLREAGILNVGNGDSTIHRPVVPSAVVEAILDDDARWLAGFLVTDAEIIAMKT